MDLFSFHNPSPTSPLSILFAYHAIDRAVTKGVDVANISFGAPGCVERNPRVTFNVIVNDAVNKGIFVAAAVGNEGINGTVPAYETITWPACSQNALAVGGIDDTTKPYQMYNYTGRGPVYHLNSGAPVLKPEIVAPGYNIILPGYSYVNGTAGYDPTIDVGIYSGTSYSTPIVSAAAALLLGEYPDLGHPRAQGCPAAGGRLAGSCPLHIRPVRDERHRR